jgi:hypothetical protein
MRLLTVAFFIISCIAGLAACTDRNGSIGLLPNAAVRHSMDNGGGIPGHSETKPTPTPTP